MDLFKEELPESFEERRDVMRDILKLGLEDLLTLARKDNMLTEPFGRTAQPTPIMTEDEFLTQKDDLNDDPVFNFQYGFNPLKHLATFINRFHPSEVTARRIEREACMTELHRRAQEAQKQLREQTQADAIASVRPSGISYGPIVSPVEGSAVRVLAKAVAPGTVVLELSLFSSFSTVAVTMEEAVAAGTNMCATFSVPDLKPGVRYFARCSLREEGYTEFFPEPVPVPTPVVDDVTGGGATEVEVEAAAEGDGENVVRTPQFKGRDGGIFQESSFWTYVPDFDYAAAAKAEAEAEAAAAAAETETEAVAAEGGAAEPEASEESAAGSGETEAAEGADAIATAVVEEEGPMGTPTAPPKINLLGLFLGPYSDEVAEKETILGPAVTLEEVVKSKDEPTFAAVLGDVFPTARIDQLRQQDGYFEQAGISFHEGNPVTGPSTSSILRSCSVLTGWNDSQAHSDVSLTGEEIVYKQYLHDLKHWTRKYKDGGDKKKRSSSRKDNNKNIDAPPEPVLNRPPQSQSLTGLKDVLPVHISADAATRNVYSSYFVSSDVHVVSLDMRRGVIGKQQSRWLREVLTKSPATWKIVLCGAPFGVDSDVELVRVSSSDGVRVTVSNDEIGDYGFSNYSLEHAVHKLHDYALTERKRAAQETDAGDASTDADARAGVSEVAEVPPEADISADTGAAVETEGAAVAPAGTGEEGSDVLARASAVSSGVVLFSGSRCGAYVAHLDPLRMNENFLVEVCCGSALSIQDPPGLQGQGPVAAPPMPGLKSGINGDVVWTGPHNRSTLGSLTVHPSGALEVKIVDATVGDVLHTAYFKKE